MKDSSMTCDEVMTQLESMGHENTRRLYAGYGAGSNQFGVPIGNLRSLARQLNTNHPLALKLWATGNTDAMMLACMILDPAKVSAKQAEGFLKTVSYYRLIDEFAEKVLGKISSGDELRVRWMDSDQEMLGRAGWLWTIHKIEAGSFEDLDFDELLMKIRDGILDAPKRKQEAMNRCLVEIGVHNSDYTEICIALGEMLGRFDKTPVPRGCIPTYAPEWIAAALKKKK